MVSSDFSPNVRHAIRIEISAALLLTAFTGLTAPFNGLILRRELGATALQLSMLAAANAACLLLSLSLARVIDTRRPLPWVVWPGFAARALFLLVPFIRSPWPFVGVLVGGNLMGAVAGPAQATLVQQMYPADQRGRALGTIRVAAAFVAIAFAAGAGQLMGRVSYRWVFFVAALLGMAASLRLLRLPVPAVAPSAAIERPRLAEAWQAIRNDAPYRWLLLASFIFGTGIWLMTPATPLLLADVVGASTAQVGLFAAAAAGAALVGNVLWGHLADRRSSLHALQVVYAVGMLTPFVYYVAAQGARTPWVLVGAFVSESLMATGLDLVWMLAVIDFAGPGRTAQYAAIAATLAGVRGVISPLVGAAIIESSGVHAVYLVAAALMACGAALVGLQLRSQKTPRYLERPRQSSSGPVSNSATLNAS